MRRIGLAVVIAIAMAGTAQAATFETAKRVSQTAVGTADRDATNANVAATTFGWFAAWDSDAAQNGVDKLYGQRLNLTGAEVGGDTSIPSPSPSHELSIPDVAYDHERDRALVVARGKPIGVNRIYATLLNASTGAQIGSELEVSAGSDFNGHVAYSAIHDEYLVVFEHTTGTGTDRLFARRISADGALVGSAAKEVSQLDGQVRWNDVEALTTGGWIATWTQDRAGADPVGGWDVHAQVLAPSGATLAESGTNDRQVSPDGHNARNSVIARDPATDKLLAVWDEVTTTREINARILNPDGSSPAAAFALSTTGAGSPREPDVAGGRPGGGWLVTWETGESFRRIATQEISGAGAQVGEDLIISPAAADVPAPGAQRPDIASHPDGSWLVGYEMASPDDRSEIYVQRGTSGGSGSTPEPPPPPPPPADCAPNCSFPSNTIKQPGAGVPRSGKGGRITLPSAKRCVRSLRLRVKPSTGAKVASTTVYVNGKRKLHRTGKKATKRLVLRRLPKGRFTVRVVMRLTDKRKVTAKRKYRRCA